MVAPEIRPFRPTDEASVLRVWEDASRAGHPFLDEAFLAVERERIPRAYLPRTQTWVYQRGERVIGFISLLEQQVAALFVDPSCHRQGVGCALMDVAKRQRAELEVEVFEKNVTGRAFYESCGFVWDRREIHRETGEATVHLKYRPGD